MRCTYDESSVRSARDVRTRLGLFVMACVLVVPLSGPQAWGKTAELRPAGAKAARTVLLVAVPDDAAWQDMAYLAAVPAGTKANGGKGAVVALPASGAIDREAADYLRRYKPMSVFTLGGAVKAPAKAAGQWKALVGKNAQDAACAVARTFWQASDTAVLCRDDDYASALVASTLAGRLRVPLLYGDETGVSANTGNTLKKLGVGKVIVIGSAGKATAGLKKLGATVTELADAKGVLGWMRKNKHAVTYVAAVNPTDRTATIIKKLSLAAPLLAAGRGGMVVPLAYESQWKVAFTGTPCGKELPKGIPAARGKSAAQPRKGTIEMDGRKFAFVATGGIKGGPHRLYVDLNGNGAFDDDGEGPLATAQTIKLGTKDCVISLGERSGVGKADVRLTWPSAEHVRGDLQKHYAIMGSLPEYLCLVGFLDALPQAVMAKEPGRFGDMLSDLPYADNDDDPFVEIGVARLIAENASLATVYASRVLTYSDLLDPKWQDSLGQARWENTYWPLFENMSFTQQHRHDRDDLKWLVKPGPGPKDKGKRAKDFDADSPLTDVAAMTHLAHSWWKDLGQTFSWDSTTLLAPMVVESGGCLTATLDREPDCRSVIARMLRNGAAGFVGNIRPGMANQEQQRLEFWNGILAGHTMGRSHRDAQNSMILTVLDNNQMGGGYHHYSLHIRALFGDPAFAMRVPSSPKSAPARVTVAGDIVSVHAPATWWPVSIRVPEDWKKWADKSLYVVRGAGTYPVRRWCGEQYDREETYHNAAIRTSKRIKGITQVQKLASPLGWASKYWADEHADGTRTYRWRVRLIDFDQINGKIVSKTDRVDYRIEWGGK